MVSAGTVKALAPSAISIMVVLWRLALSGASC
jgi:hypothetical protein